jgi:hypothetical protein
VLTAETNAAPDAERQVQIFRSLPAAYVKDPTFDEDFKTFACVGLDDGADASADLATATQAANIVGTLTAKSSDKLDEVIASYRKYENSPAPSVDLPKPPSKKRVDACRDLAKAGLADMRPVLAKPNFGPAAALAALSALEALYNSAKTLYTDFAKIEDASVREKRLIEFLNSADKPADQTHPAVPGTDSVMIAALGNCAHYDPATSVDKDMKVVITAACAGPLTKGGTVDELFRLHVASTLVTPFVQYVDTQRDWNGGNPAKPMAPHEYVERMQTVRANLADFDALRTQSSPGDLALPIAKAYLNLRRIADGKLTPDEKAKAVSAEINEFFALMDQLSKDVTDLQSKADAAKTAVQKL